MDLIAKTLAKRVFFCQETARAQGEGGQLPDRAPNVRLAFPPSLLGQHPLRVRQQPQASLCGGDDKIL